jgi:hypothetical protein
VTALQLNVDFSDSGVTLGAPGIPFGDLVIQGVAEYPLVNSRTVRHMLSEMETVLGGGSSVFQSIPLLTQIAIEINASFDSGLANSWANAHLRLPPFLNGDFITYPQASWGDTPAAGNAASLLADNYNAVYAASGGVFEVGFPGIFGYSAQFTSAGALLNYLPQSGPDGRLLADYVNPLTTNAGRYGGEVAALKLNIDFADAGLTLGSVGVSFGNLELYDVPPLSEPGFTLDVNGMTVRELFSSTVNGYLGSSDFGPNPIPYLNALAEELNRAFDAGQYSNCMANHTPLPNDPTPGNVSMADYHYWKSHYGLPLGNGAFAGGVVPEPSTLGLMLACLLSLMANRAGVRSGDNLPEAR